MRFRALMVTLAVLSTLDTASEADPGLKTKRAPAGYVPSASAVAKSRIDSLLSAYKKSKTFEDGIVVVVKNGQIVAEAATRDTDGRSLFDVASLTKPIVTAPAVALLEEAGLLSLSDPVSKYLPEFLTCSEPWWDWMALRTKSVRKGKRKIKVSYKPQPPAYRPCEEKSQITIEQLLRHRSGLRDIPREIFESSKATPEQKTGFLKTRSATARPDATFEYADINFLLLGEIVRKVVRENALGSGMEDFVRTRVFQKLGMDSSRYKLTEDELKRAKRSSKYIDLGVVNDPSARSISECTEPGNAGLFASGEDLAKFSAMLLNYGKFKDQTVIDESIVKRMVEAPESLPRMQKRALGWDVATDFSDPFRDVFGGGYGHTGWTGTAIWVVPEQGLALIILTNRSFTAGSFDRMHQFRESVAKAVKQGFWGK